MDPDNTAAYSPSNASANVFSRRMRNELSMNAFQESDSVHVKKLRHQDLDQTLQW